MFVEVRGLRANHCSHTVNHDCIILIFKEESLWINEQVKIHQLPRRLRGGAGVRGLQMNLYRLINS